MLFEKKKYKSIFYELLAGCVEWYGVFHQVGCVDCYARDRIISCFVLRCVERQWTSLMNTNGLLRQSETRVQRCVHIIPYILRPPVI